jgi:hypothetical protein
MNLIIAYSRIPCFPLYEPLSKDVVTLTRAGSFKVLSRMELKLYSVPDVTSPASDTSNYPYSVAVYRPNSLDFYNWVIRVHVVNSEWK